MKNSLELAYIAGVLDSDGSFCISVDTSRQRCKGLSPAFLQQVILKQMQPEAVNLASELFGGRISLEETSGEFRKPVYVWYAGNRNAVEVARQLLPYLRIKKRQAELLIELHEVKNRPRHENRYAQETGTRNTRWGPRPYKRFILKPEVIEEMARITLACRALNDTRHRLPMGRLPDGLRVREIIHPLSQH